MVRIEVWYVDGKNSDRDQRFWASEGRILEPQVYKMVSTHDIEVENVGASLSDLWRAYNDPSADAELEKPSGVRSLSVGDLVVLDDRTSEVDPEVHLCDKAGWTEVGFNPNEPDAYFVVHYGRGKFVARKEDGEVLSSIHFDGTDPDELPSISFFDVEEWRESHDGLGLPAEIDLIDVGFQTEEGEYVRPSAHTRMTGRPG